MGDIRLFVSHAHTDKEIAVALVAVVEEALIRPVRRDGRRDGILCTSHDNPQYREPENADVSTHLRDHLSESSCVLGVLTPNSIKSPWCLFELGGAWARATKTFPLLAGGLSPGSLPAALRGAAAAYLTEADQIDEVLSGVGQALDWDRRPTNGSAAQEIARLVAIARSYRGVRHEEWGAGASPAPWRQRENVAHASWLIPAHGASWQPTIPSPA